MHRRTLIPALDLRAGPAVCQASPRDTLVLAETQRFHLALPALLQRCPGRWIVFRDGQVHSDHKTEDEAYVAAVEKFGVDGAFVIAPVAEVTPTPITAGVLYGMA